MTLTRSNGQSILLRIGRCNKQRRVDLVGGKGFLYPPYGLRIQLYPFMREGLPWLLLPDSNRDSFLQVRFPWSPPYLVVDDLPGLMFGFKQIVDRFDRAKGSDRHLYKKGNPFCHGPIP